MPNCPNCGSSNSIPIIYGEPSPELMEQARKGEVALGGCIIYPDRNLFHCKDCEFDYK